MCRDFEKLGRWMDMRSLRIRLNNLRMAAFTALGIPTMKSRCCLEIIESESSSRFSNSRPVGVPRVVNLCDVSDITVKIMRCEFFHVRIV